jgi:hypothetical protein
MSSHSLPRYTAPRHSGLQHDMQCLVFKNDVQGVDKARNEDNLGQHITALADIFSM